MLEKYKPDLIIVLGKRLWNNMPSNGTWSNKNVNNNSNEWVYIYSANEKKIPAYRIIHPSSKLGYNWHSYIDSFCKESASY